MDKENPQGTGVKATGTPTVGGAGAPAASTAKAAPTVELQLPISPADLKNAVELSDTTTQQVTSLGYNHAYMHSSTQIYF